LVAFWHKLGGIHNVANIVWQLFAKQANLGPHKSFSILQNLFDKRLDKSLEKFHKIWFEILS
jgi:hypothetical protein